MKKIAVYNFVRQRIVQLFGMIDQASTSMKTFNRLWKWHRKPGIDTSVRAIVHPIDHIIT